MWKHGVLYCSLFIISSSYYCHCFRLNTPCIIQNKTPRPLSSKYSGKINYNFSIKYRAIMASKHLFFLKFSIYNPWFKYCFLDYPASHLFKLFNTMSLFISLSQHAPLQQWLVLPYEVQEHLRLHTLLLFPRLQSAWQVH